MADLGRQRGAHLPIGLEQPASVGLAVLLQAIRVGVVALPGPLLVWLEKLDTAVREVHHASAGRDIRRKKDVDTSALQLVGCSYVQVVLGPGKSVHRSFLLSEQV